jgi:hypothetical protein
MTGCYNHTSTCDAHTKCNFQRPQAMDITTALQNVQANRKAVLFLGAGFSNPTNNLLGLQVPSASQLAARIIDKLGIPGTAPLGLAVDKLREKLSPADGFDFISNQLTIASLVPEQTKLLALPWTRIYTTNIDNVGKPLSGRSCVDVTVDSSPVKFGDFVYLHGCISNCNPTNFYQNLKLGEQLYLSNTRSGSGYFHMLKQDLYECDVAVVVGYSMADPDLATIFFNSEELLNKCFVFSGATDELSSHRISLIGTNTGLGLVELVSRIDARPVATAPTLRSDLTEDRGTFDSKDVTQTIRQNMLIYGRFDVNAARTSWANDGPAYVIKRGISDRLAMLEAACIVIVHSHLGNGKTLIFEYLRFLLARQGRNVVIVRPELSDNNFAEALKEIPPNSYVFFEGDVFSLSHAIQVVRERSLALLATSRSTTVRVAMPALSKAASGVVPIQLIDANKLNASELADFHNLIDSMAFWPPDLAELPRDKRISKLEQEFDSSVSAIVLKIFENERIRKEILNQWQTALPDLCPLWIISLSHLTCR